MMNVSFLIKSSSFELVGLNLFAATTLRRACRFKVADSNLGGVKVLQIGTNLDIRWALRMTRLYVFRGVEGGSSVRKRDGSY